MALLVDAEQLAAAVAGATAAAVAGAAAAAVAAAAITLVEISPINAGWPVGTPPARANFD